MKITQLTPYNNAVPRKSFIGQNDDGKGELRMYNNFQDIYNGPLRSLNHIYYLKLFF